MIVNSIKPHKIPERLIYTNKGISKIFSTKTGMQLGYIKTQKTQIKSDDFYPNYQGAESLYIKYLEVIPFARRQGIGTELIKFAKHLSRKNGAEGRIHCIAWNFEHPGDAPHKFYKKQGFTTTDKKTNEAIDFAIKHDIPIPPRLTQGTPMYLEKFWNK